MLTNWQRIEKIVKWTGLSVNAFARAIGLNRSENLYQIKKGNNGISRDLVELITKKYPSISKAWLLTGEGKSMFITETQSAAGIPYYETDAVRVVLSEAMPAPNYHLNMPMLGDSDFAALAFGWSMHPDIPQGSSIIVKAIDPANLLPGEDYLVVSEKFTGIRTVRTIPGSAMLRLSPRNTAQFDEMEIDPDSILKLYIIRAVIINKVPH